MNLLNKSAKKLTRFEFLDIIRAYATILVIVVHSSGPVLYAFSSLPESTWMTANYFNSFARTCVPLFIMVSGFLLLNPNIEETLPHFFKKRFSKILIPYLFFSIFYLWWKHNIRLEPLSFDQALHQFWSGTPDYHLVFMSVLIGLYLLTPILRIFIQHALISTQVYFISMWFLVICVSYFLTKFTGYSINPYLKETPLFLGYYLLGAYFRQITCNVRLVYLFAGIVSGWLFTALMTYKYSKLGKGFDATFYGYISPNVVLMTICSFLFLQNKSLLFFLNQSPMLMAGLKKLSTASFGIYLVHVAILDLLATGKLGQWLHLPIVLKATTLTPILSIPLLTGIVLVISALLVLYLQSIPLINRLVPR